jgi:hypothetical protein
MTGAEPEKQLETQTCPNRKAASGSAVGNYCMNVQLYAVFQTRARRRAADNETHQPRATVL